MLLIYNIITISQYIEDRHTGKINMEQAKSFKITWEPEVSSIGFLNILLNMQNVIICCSAAMEVWLMIRDV